MTRVANAEAGVRWTLTVGKGLGPKVSDFFNVGLDGIGEARNSNRPRHGMLDLGGRQLPCDVYFERYIFQLLSPLDPFGNPKAENAGRPNPTARGFVSILRALAVLRRDGVDGTVH